MSRLPRRSGLKLRLAVLLGAGAIAGCHQTSTAPGGTARILSISPSIIQAGPSPQVLRFSGANLGSSYSLFMIAPGGLTNEVPPAELQVLGSDTFQATVTLPSSGVYAFAVRSQAGELSTAFNLTVGDVTGFPSITYISPPSVLASTQVRTFSIGGTHFEQGLSIVLAAPDGSISTVSPADIGLVTDTTFQANLTLTKTGAYLVSIVNPSGPSSNLFPISVTK
jgi:hypothetical protein